MPAPAALAERRDNVRAVSRRCDPGRNQARQGRTPIRDPAEKRGARESDREPDAAALPGIGVLDDIVQNLGEREFQLRRILLAEPTRKCRADAAKRGAHFKRIGPAVQRQMRRRLRRRNGAILHRHPHILRQVRARRAGCETPRSCA